MIDRIEIEEISLDWEEAIKILSTSENFDERLFRIVIGDSKTKEYNEDFQYCALITIRIGFVNYLALYKESHVELSSIQSLIRINIAYYYNTLYVRPVASMAGVRIRDDY